MSNERDQVQLATSDENVLIRRSKVRFAVVLNESKYVGKVQQKRAILNVFNVARQRLTELKDISLLGMSFTITVFDFFKRAAHKQKKKWCVYSNESRMIPRLARLYLAEE